MIKRMNAANMGKSDLGWLKSRFHFSFADYCNPKNVNFGVLRVLNDDLVKAGTGFDTHPHKNMEIVSYVVNGELSHADSMGNQRTLCRGEVQYMSAGTGVRHSEHNRGEELLRFLQIWILPDQDGRQPNYGEYRFKPAERDNKWLHMVSPCEGSAPVKINQDVNIYVVEMAANSQQTFSVSSGRQAYLVLIEGEGTVNGREWLEGDAMEVVEEDLTIDARHCSHVMLLEMQKANG